MLERLIGNVPVADGQLIEALELSTVAACDRLISICDDMAGWWSENTGIDRSSIDVIRTPMSFSESLPARKGRFSATYPTIFFLGRVERLKGADLLVEALPAVVSEFPEARLLIGGPETTEYGHERPFGDFLRQRLSELGLSQHVDFLGAMGRREIIEMAVEADICAFPSRYETACYACIEAMSYGAFCLATRVGGLQEYCKHSESGWLVDPNDPKALAEGIIHAVNDDLRKNCRSGSGTCARLL
ncbi:MAG: glycosyltransferase family 4 protein [Candidatus Melainabacteria bacterium]|nr:glycosyltransferase family 4 protein [Candidatus Melainabacteria bacterium]